MTAKKLVASALRKHVIIEEICNSYSHAEHYCISFRNGRKAVREQGVVGKQNVLIMVGSTPIEGPKTGQKDSHVRYFKGKVLNTHKKNELSAEVSASLDEGTIVFSCKNTLCVDIADYVELHVTEKSSEKIPKKL